MVVILSQELFMAQMEMKHIQILQLLVLKGNFSTSDRVVIFRSGSFGAVVKIASTE